MSSTLDADSNKIRVSDRAFKIRKEIFVLGHGNEHFFVD